MDFVNERNVVVETGNIVAKNGNNVETAFDTVERIVQLVAFDNVAWTLLLVWTGLKPNGRRLSGNCSAVAALVTARWVDDRSGMPPGVDHQVVVHKQCTATARAGRRR